MSREQFGVNRIQEVAAKSERFIAGLSSGTSADGVDAALVRIENSGERLRVHIVGHNTYPYTPELRNTVLSLSEGRGSAMDVCELNYRLGETFANACLSLLEESDFSVGHLDAIGSHGQTVCHNPPSARKGPTDTVCTLQLGEPAIIAELTGAIVVHSFRSADMAAGGEGAPLAPCLDYILFGREQIARCFLNIGGIANLTSIPANQGWEKVMGFDTGPGNMVIDYVAKRFFGEDCDRDGELSRNGVPSDEILRIALDHDFFSKPPPKSAGREIFGSSYSEELIRLAKNKGISREDLLATTSMLTACSAHTAYQRFIEQTNGMSELYVSGGGGKNTTLLRFIADLFSPVPVYSTERLGVPPDAKEALLFAVLANQAIIGEPSSLPQVTGATRRVILGNIVV